MPSYACARCEMEFNTGDATKDATDCKKHIHGTTVGSYHYAPKCKIVPEKFYKVRVEGGPKCCIEFALAQEKDIIERDTLLHDIKRSVFTTDPPAPVQIHTTPDETLLTEDEIYALPDEETKRYAVRVTKELLKRRTEKAEGVSVRRSQDVPLYEVYVRVRRNGRPYRKLYVGSAKSVYERRGGGGRSATREGAHRAIKKRAFRDAGIDYTAEDDRDYVIIASGLTERQARSGEWCLYTAFDKSELSNATSPPFYWPFFYDDETKEWTRPTLSRLRAMWCELLVDAIRRLIKSREEEQATEHDGDQDPDKSHEAESGDEEEEQEPAPKRTRRE